MTEVVSIPVMNMNLDVIINVIISVIINTLTIFCPSYLPSHTLSFIKVEKNILRAAASDGVNPKRIFFADREEKSTHILR